MSAEPAMGRNGPHAYWIQDSVVRDRDQDTDAQVQGETKHVIA